MAKLVYDALSLCVYVFGEVLGMPLLLNIFHIGDTAYLRAKMNRPHINAIYHFVAYKNP